jgi:mannose-6-phosphate isomerase-like protein (cupin superfamily)
MENIEHFRAHGEFYTDERCYITELHNTDADEDCSIARARVEPGVTTRLHRLEGTIERYVILEGMAEVTVGSAGPVAVQPLDIVNIPAGAEQCISNTGECDLVFLCICTPRFRQQNYVDLDKSS